MPDEIYIKHLFGNKVDLPEVKSGQILYVEDTRSIFADQNNQRIRYNPPANWNETNIEDPSYIENKPELGTVSSQDLASTVNDSQKIPNISLVNSIVSSGLNDSVKYENQIKSDGEKLQARSNIGAAASSDLQITNQNVSSLQLDFENAERWKSEGEEGNVLSKDENGDLVWVPIENQLTNIEERLENINKRVNLNSLRIYPIDKSMIWLENTGSSIDIISLITNADDDTNVRITNFDNTVSTTQEIETFYAKLDTMNGISTQGTLVEDEPQISGIIRIESINGSTKEVLDQKYSNIQIISDNITAVVTFMSEDGLSTIGSVNYNNGIAQTNLPAPVKESTNTQTYSLDGWNTSQGQSVVTFTNDTEVLKDMTVYPVFTEHVRMYNAFFIRSAEDGGGTLQTVQVEYGGTPEYTGATPTTIQGTYEEFEFVNFTPEIGPIYEDTTYTANFRERIPVVTNYLTNTLTDYKSKTNTVIREYAFQGRTALKTVTGPMITIEQYAFSGCTGLTLVDLNSNSGSIIIAANAFNGCTNLETFYIRSSVMATLSATSAFTGTKIASKTGTIYVPESLVETYQANANWANYNIAAISE